jgi:hypothetical protein
MGDFFKIKNILLSMAVLAGSLSWGGASASSSHAEMRAYYVDPALPFRDLCINRGD